MKYSMVIWDSSKMPNASKIESFQMQFLIFALTELGRSIRLATYEARLQLVKLESLADRLRLTTLSFTHSWVSGNSNVSSMAEVLRF